MDKKYYLGGFFLFVQMIVILRNYLDGYNYYFWFCDFAPILFSIAFFIGNKNIIKGLINFGLIPQAIFLIDFIYAFVAGTSPLGVNEVLPSLASFYAWSTIFLHLTTFFALFFTFRIKPSKKDLWYSMIIIFAVYFVTLIFTSPSDGVNFVYSTENLFRSFNVAIPLVVWLWPLLAFLFVILPAHGIQWILYRLSKKMSVRKPKKDI